MSFSLENQGSGTFLVYTLGSEEEIDSMGLGRLSNNKVPGLISLLYTQMDTTRYIKYNVSSKMSASQFFGGIVRKKQLLGIFGGIVRALTSAEEYIIRVFLKNIMFSTQFDQSENCDYVAKIINYLNSSAPFSACGFKKLLDEIERGNDFQSGRPSSNTVPAAPQITAPPQPAPNVQPVQANQPVGVCNRTFPYSSLCLLQKQICRQRIRKRAPPRRQRRYKLPLLHRGDQWQFQIKQNREKWRRQARKKWPDVPFTAL